MIKPIDTKKGRFYPWESERYVSVTTILGEGLPKPALNNWKVRNMAELAAQNRETLAPMTEQEAKEWLLAQRMSGGEEAASLGSTLHSIFDDLANGNMITVSADSPAYPYVTSFLKFMEEQDPKYIETEAAVFSRTHGYAGTLDFICEIDGKVVIGDYKTGKAVWPEAALQIAAYRYADFIGRSDGREDPLPTCSRSIVLHIRPSGYRMVDISTGPEVLDTFLSALDLYRWINVDSDYVIKETS